MYKNKNKTIIHCRKETNDNSIFVSVIINSAYTQMEQNLSPFFLLISLKKEKKDEKMFKRWQIPFNEQTYAPAEILYSMFNVYAPDDKNLMGGMPRRCPTLVKIRFSAPLFSALTPMKTIMPPLQIWIYPWCKKILDLPL